MLQEFFQNQIMGLNPGKDGGIKWYMDKLSPPEVTVT